MENWGVRRCVCARLFSGPPQLIWLCGKTNPLRGQRTRSLAGSSFLKVRDGNRAEGVITAGIKSQNSLLGLAGMFFFNQLIYSLINRRRRKWPTSFPQYQKVIKIMNWSFNTQRGNSHMTAEETKARLSWEEKDSEFY